MGTIKGNLLIFAKRVLQSLIGELWIITISGRFLAKTTNILIPPTVPVGLLLLRCGMDTLMGIMYPVGTPAEIQAMLLPHLVTLSTPTHSSVRHQDNTLIILQCIRVTLQATTPNKVNTPSTMPTAAVLS